MYKQIVERSFHMTCDICGKTETIKEENHFKAPGWWTRHWSSVAFTHFPEWSNCNTTDRLDLCPTCTKKFKKLVKMTEVEESEE